MKTCLNETNAHAALIETHAHAMPTMSQVHHIYTEPITTIQSELCIDPKFESNENVQLGQI